MPKDRPRGFSGGDDEDPKADLPLGEDTVWWLSWFLLIVFGIGALGWVVAAWLADDWYVFEMQKICRHMLEQSGKTVCYIEKGR
jgi:hypothetical protein